MRSIVSTYRGQLNWRYRVKPWFMLK